MVLFLLLPSHLFKEKCASFPGSVLRYAKVQHDTYHCHDIVEVEFPLLLPDSTLQFSRNPLTDVVRRVQIICSVILDSSHCRECHTC